jgi:CheY-like chemotaxis protein
VSFEPPQPLPPPPREVVGSCVLVVDDEQVWRLILETDLRMLGYRVAVACDAQEALALARRERPRAAIVDLMLPEPMDGWALVEGLRAQGTPTPVILYSAYPVADRRKDPDVIGCMSKATDRAELYALLPSAIRRPSD